MGTPGSGIRRRRLSSRGSRRCRGTRGGTHGPGNACVLTAKPSGMPIWTPVWSGN